MFVEQFAKFKIHLIRIWSLMNIPVQLAQIGLLLYLSIKTSGNVWVYGLIPVFIVFLAVVVWFDLPRGGKLINAEAEYAFSQTPSFMELSNDVKEIKELLKNNKKEVG